MLNQENLFPSSIRRAGYKHTIKIVRRYRQKEVHREERRTREKRTLKKRLGTDVRTSEETQSVGKNEMGKWKGRQAQTKQEREHKIERECERRMDKRFMLKFLPRGKQTISLIKFWNNT